MKRRKISRSKIDYWKWHILDQKSSGLSGVSYCNRHGLTAKTFYTWKKKLSSLEGKVLLVPNEFISSSDKASGLVGFSKVDPVSSCVKSSNAKSINPIWLAKFLKELLQ